MKLNDFTGDEQIYPDSSIFIDHHSKDSVYRNSCTEFLKNVEKGDIKATTSSLAIEETTFILLKFKSGEILKTDRHYDIINKLRTDKELFRRAWEVAEKHVLYVNALEEMGVLNIVLRMPNSLITNGIAKKYFILPRDANHLAIMKISGISDIATTDSDFKIVPGINVRMP